MFFRHNRKQKTVEKHTAQQGMVVPPTSVKLNFLFVKDLFPCTVKQWQCTGKLYNMDNLCMRYVCTYLLLTFLDSWVPSVSSPSYPHDWNITSAVQAWGVSTVLVTWAVYWEQSSAQWFDSSVQFVCTKSDFRNYCTNTFNCFCGLLLGKTPTFVMSFIQDPIDGWFLP